MWKKNQKFVEGDKIKIIKVCYNKMCLSIPGKFIEIKKGEIYLRLWNMKKKKIKMCLIEI
jgi:hypothetical protein